MLRPGPFPVGNTVSVYSRRTLIGEGGPIGTAITSAVVSAQLTTTFTGLEYETDYQAHGLDVYGARRTVQFSTDPDPSYQDVTQQDMLDIAASVVTEAGLREDADDAEAEARGDADAALDARTDSLESGNILCDESRAQRRARAPTSRRRRSRDAATARPSATRRVTSATAATDADDGRPSPDRATDCCAMLA